MRTKETLQNFQNQLGEEFGTIYSALMIQFFEIELIWHEYKILFAHSQERIDLLNRTAPSFFKVVKNTFRDDIILRINRINDPKETNLRGTITPNLSVKRIANYINDTVIKLEFDLLVKQLTDSESDIRAIRNKYISHNDLAMRTGKVDPLDGPSRRQIEGIIENLREIFRFIDEKFLDLDGGYPIDPYERGAQSLLRGLYDGVIHQNEHQEKLKQDLSIGRLKYPDHVIDLVKE
jgi:AbiU2